MGNSERMVQQGDKMIPLTIKKNGEFINMSYKTESDYFKIRDDLDDEYIKNCGSDPFLNNNKSSFYESEVVKPAHRTYWYSLEYSLRELLNHFKAILKIYGDYLILDYYFNGIFLKNDDKEMHHCQFGADDEEFEDWEFNCHLLGKPLTAFIETLNEQKQLGEIRIKSIRVELMHNKPTKNKRKRTNIPRGLRHEVFKRDDYKCVECGASKDDGATLHVDHKIPVSKGGTDELDNLQTLCKDCNLNKSDVIQ